MDRRARDPRRGALAPQDGTVSPRFASHPAALAAALALCAACSTEPEAPPPLSASEEEEKARVERLVALYQTGDPTWPSARDEALEDPRIAELLVQNFIRAMLRAHERERAGAAMVGSWTDFREHQAQLVAMGDAAAPLLAVGLRADDKVVVALVKDTLVQIGARAVAPLQSSFAASSDAAERREILSVLASIGGVPMIEVFARYLGDPEWQVRGEAYLSLGRIAASFGADAAARQRVRELLVRGFGDGDAFVRRQAVKGLAEMADAEALALLISRYARAQELRLSVEERQDLLQVLRRTTRMPGAVRVDEFEAWLARRRGNGS